MSTTRIPVRGLVRSLVLVLALLAGTLSIVAPPRSATPPAEAATRVDKQACRRIDPNLVNGACLSYRTPSGAALTWIGTYRAPDGKVFFCIDFLYDSRLPTRSDTVSTARLVNQLGQRVGSREVAALNYVISTWAGRGSTGSDSRDAAIALIIREVMGDGVREGGVVVYPRGLDVGERVRPPIGGLGGAVMRLAQQMWGEASRRYGPYRLRLTTSDDGPVRLGRQRTYRVHVIGGSGRRVPGVRVEVICSGPIECPDHVFSKAKPRAIVVRPTDLGRFRMRVTAVGPSSDGLLYRQRGWRTHGGTTARPAGKQRGWIAQENRTAAVVRATAIVEKARPEVVTQASHQEVTPGAVLHDVVGVSGLPASYHATVRATLHGPFTAQPGPDDCTPSTEAGQVTFDVADNGTFATPTITVADVGYYTWVEDFPGDDATVPVTTRCGLVPETTRVVPFTPQVRTTVSQQRSQVGDAVRDTVVVTGVADTAVTVEWALYGPRSPRNGSCAGVPWANAPVADRGSFGAAGDGTYRTDSTTLTAAGCYTYAERIPATPLSNEAVTPPGVATETTLTRRRIPQVSTVVSDQRALVGDQIRDRIRIGGLHRDDDVTVEWWLHGPIAPAAGTSCLGLSWQGAPVADSGSFVAHGGGEHETRATTLDATGCYTYRERLAPTASTEAASTPPGVPSETSLVTRPVTPYVPEVPSGFEIAADEAYVPTRRAKVRWLERRYHSPEVLGRAARAAGGTLAIPRLHIKAGVASVGLDHGTMAIPNAPGRLGWLRTTATADDLIGSSVISGHVSDRHDRPGALWRLKGARRGDTVTWRSGGRTHRFVVTGVRHFPRTQGVPARYFRTNGPHLLHLITCTNRTTTSSGGFHYLDNIVVTAEAR